MAYDLAALKRSLRIEHSDHDTLLSDCLAQGVGRVEDILGFTLDTLTEVPKAVERAVIIAASHFYSFDDVDFINADSQSGLSRLDMTLNSLLINHRQFDTETEDEA